MCHFKIGNIRRTSVLQYFVIIIMTTMVTMIVFDNKNVKILKLQQ